MINIGGNWRTFHQIAAPTARAVPPFLSEAANENAARGSGEEVKSVPRR